MELAWPFIRAFLLTAAVEALVMLLLCRNPRYMYYSLLCNLLTNPAMNVALWLLTGALGVQFYAVILLALEAAVVVVEGAVYHSLIGWRWGKALLASLLLNAASFLVGRVLYFLL